MHRNAEQLEVREENRKEWESEEGAKKKKRKKKTLAALSLSLPLSTGGKIKLGSVSSLFSLSSSSDRFIPSFIQTRARTMPVAIELLLECECGRR